MLVSVSWLKRYVEIPVDISTLAHDLTMLGVKVERLHRAGPTNSAVVIGRVLETQRHPDADRLTLCRVDVGGGEPLQIVCGAPNVAAGQTVPVALPGAALPGGFKIRKSKIRGVVSNGMICSEVELGMGEDASGIMVLDTEAAPGTTLSDALGGDEPVLEIEVTPNRPDHLGHIGVAREVAARYGVPLRLPEANVQSSAEGEPCFSVRIENPEDCYRFTGRVVRGVRVGPSPAWLRGELERVGLKSVNNIVDVTNFVMLEYGQPLHAYDLRRLHGRIGVRRGRKDERLAALDEATYTVGSEALLITDDDTPIGVAGVIGGMDTRVTEETVDLLIESAAFNSRLVRRTRRALNLSTDASYRFERGSDRTVCMTASDRAARLILEIAGGTAGEAVDAFPAPLPPHRIVIRRSYTCRVLGLSLSSEEITSLLERLSFACSGANDSITASVPAFRVDVAEEADLVEEVARLYGYDRIGQGWSFRSTTPARFDAFDGFVQAVASHLCARGFTEVMTSSFTDGREVAVMAWGADDSRARPVEIRNPLSGNHRFLRTSLLPGLLGVVQRNADRGNKDIRVFHCGPVFLARREGGLPEESARVLMVCSRPPGKEFWSQSKFELDLYDIKGETERVLSAVRADLERMAFSFDPASGRFQYVDRGRTVVEGGAVGAAVCAAYEITQPLWWAEVDLAVLFELRSRRSAYRPVSPYPVSKRDLSLVTPAGVDWAQIEKVLVKHAGRLLESHRVFDVYRGESLPEGQTAYGVRLQFRSAEGTLRDADVDAAVAKVVSRLQSDLGVVLRS